MARLRRLDAELVRRGLARSREQASALIHEGRVRVGGSVAFKPATQVDPAVAILVAADETDPGYASRGGYKLAGALDHFADRLTVAGKHCLDAGASTGGFTDVLLRRGAAHVVAVDVGYGQLAWNLQTDERVTVIDRQNVRTLEPGQVVDAEGLAPQLVVSDLSFISLTLVLPALAAAAPGADQLLMVKPQFEVGKERLGSGGVVRDPAARRDAVLTVARAGAEVGLGVHGVVASPLPGPSGNVEYFVWFAPGAASMDAGALDRAVEQAIEEGPQ